MRWIRDTSTPIQVPSYEDCEQPSSGEPLHGGPCHAVPHPSPVHQPHPGGALPCSHWGQGYLLCHHYIISVRLIFYVFYCKCHSFFYIIGVTVLFKVDFTFIRLQYKKRQRHSHLFSFVGLILYFRTRNTNVV